MLNVAFEKLASGGSQQVCTTDVRARVYQRENVLKLIAKPEIATLDGPGLTVDEPLDVRPGRTYLAVLRSEGRHFFDRAVVDRVFRDNAEHPPLGRWLLGVASVLGEPFEVLVKGPDPTGHYVLAGRLAPAVTFASFSLS